MRRVHASRVMSRTAAKGLHKLSWHFHSHLEPALVILPSKGKKKITFLVSQSRAVARFLVGLPSAAAPKES